MERPKNSEIEAKKVIVIQNDGKNLGEYDIANAIALAESHDLDLIQITFTDLPVCKIGNYSKFLYEEKRKTKHIHKPDGSSKLKEVKFKTAISEHDLQTKISQIANFLNRGNRVQITVQLNRHQKEKFDIAKGFVDNVLEGISGKYILQGNPFTREYAYGIILMSTVKKGK